LLSIPMGIEKHDMWIPKVFLLLHTSYPVIQRGFEGSKQALSMYVQRFVNQFSRGLQSATLLPWFIPDSGSVRE
jgi:hypothetical protein